MGGRLFQLILAIKCKCQSREEQIQAELGLSPAEFNGLMALEADQKTSGCAVKGQGVFYWRFGLDRVGRTENESASRKKIESSFHLPFNIFHCAEGDLFLDIHTPLKDKGGAEEGVRRSEAQS